MCLSESLIMTSLSLHDRPLSHYAVDCLKGKKVLVVDDQPDARLLLERIFTHKGADVLSASSVTEALELLQSFEPDILVSDIAMPELSGYDLIRELRQGPEPVRDIPAIAVSGHAGYEEVERTLAEGFQSLMIKPLNFARLVALVVHLLDQNKPKPLNF